MSNELRICWLGCILLLGLFVTLTGCGVPDLPGPIGIPGL
jgi:hypothetical protein